jgi:hypothetical protein
MFASLAYMVPALVLDFRPYTPTYDLPFSGLSSGEEVLLILGAAPLALAGLALSFRGRRSSSRRRLAIAGMILSLVALVPFAWLLVAIYELTSYCSAHSCF